MLGIKKKIVVSAMFSLVAISMGVTLSNADYSLKAVGGAECEHYGNHYIQLNSTSTSSGVKEYWVCCKCNNHFLEEVNGDWTDTNTYGEALDEDDDRYIPSLSDSKYQTYLASTLDDMGFTYKIETDKNGNTKTTLNGFDVTKCKDPTRFVIPEGVTKIDGDLLLSIRDQVEYIVIPASLTDYKPGLLGTKDTVKNYGYCDVKVYFVATVRDPKMDGADPSNIYSGQGVTWDYVNGVPTPITNN